MLIACFNKERRNIMKFNVDDLRIPMTERVSKLREEVVHASLSYVVKGLY